MSEETTAVVVAEPAVPAPSGRPPVLELRTIEDQLRFAEIVVKSGLALGHKSKESVVVALNYGAELGLSPMQALRSVQVISGRPGLSADASVGIVLGHPSKPADYFVEVATTDERSTWETRRRDVAETHHDHVAGDEWTTGKCPCGCGAVRGTFTLAEAKRAGLLSRSDTWSKYPARMLSARAKQFLARDVYPEVMGGVLSDEEIGGFAGRPAAPNGGDGASGRYRAPQRRSATMGAGDPPAAPVAEPAPRLVIDADAKETVVVPDLAARVTTGADGDTEAIDTSDLFGEPADGDMPASRPEILAFIQACKDAGKTEVRVKDYLLCKYDLRSRKDIPVRLLPALMEWARDGV